MSAKVVDSALLDGGGLVQQVEDLNKKKGKGVHTGKQAKNIHQGGTQP